MRASVRPLSIDQAGLERPRLTWVVTRGNSDRIHALDATRLVCRSATTFPVRQSARVGSLGGAGRTAPRTRVPEWTRWASTRCRCRFRRRYGRFIWIVHSSSRATDHASERSRPCCCSCAVDHSRSRRRSRCWRRSARDASSSSTRTTSQNARTVSPCRRRTGDGTSRECWRRRGGQIGRRDGGREDGGGRDE